MNSENIIELERTIITVLPVTMFRVALPSDHLLLAYILGNYGGASSGLQRRMLFSSGRHQAAINPT